MSSIIEFLFEVVFRGLFEHGLIHVLKLPGTIALCLFGEKKRSFMEHHQSIKSTGFGTLIWVACIALVVWLSSS